MQHFGAILSYTARAMADCGRRRKPPNLNATLGTPAQSMPTARVSAAKKGERKTWTP